MTNDIERSLDYQVIKLCVEHMRSSGYLISAGDRAALKRMNPLCPHPVFWRLLAQIGSENGEMMELPTWKESHLALTLKCMAIMSPYHAGDANPGRALKQAGYSEARVGRLLRATNQPFHDYLTSACRYMKSKQAGWNWYQFYRLASSLPESKQRRALARSFYI